MMYILYSFIFENERRFVSLAQLLSNFQQMYVSLPSILCHSGCIVPIYAPHKFHVRLGSFVHEVEGQPHCEQRALEQGDH